MRSDRRSDLREIVRWLAYIVLALSLIVAVLLRGGFDPAAWAWISAALSSACFVSLTVRSRSASDPTPLEIYLLAVLLLWMLLQMAPLPPAVVAWLSPRRWADASAARAFVGFPLGAWLPISVAPAATLERLLYVVPAMAAFVAAREVGRWWRRKSLWIAVAPVVVAALIESLLGLVQFYAGQAAPGGAQSVSGTYVNRNHFAGLLGMGLPLALAWAIASWDRARQPLRATLQIGLLLAAVACILAAMVASLSRGGFMAALAAIATVLLGWLHVRNQRGHVKTSRWLWVAAVLVPLGLGLFLATSAMVVRLAELPGVGEVTMDGRVQLWSEALHLIGAYPWTGTGIGAYQQGLYPFRTFEPALTVDYAHNDYLQAFAELGLLGGLVALVFAGVILWRALRALGQRRSKNWAVALGLVGSFVAIGLHSIVDFNLYIPANCLALAWLGGVACSPPLRELE